MKVLGYKVSDSFYNNIKEEYGNVSEFLRDAVEHYLNSKVNQVNSNSEYITQDDEYKMLRKCLDSVERRINKDSEKELDEK